MKLAHFDLESVFDIKPGEINILVVEAEDQFYKYQKEIYMQCQGEDGGFCLFEGDKDLSFDKQALLIKDYFFFDLNDKKLINKLYASLSEITLNSFEEKYWQIKEMIKILFAELDAESECSIDYEEENGIINLMKAFGVHVKTEDSLLGNLSAYIKLNTFYLKKRCVFLVNLKTVLTEAAVKMFYHEMALNEISVFLLENTLKTKLEGEKITIIDRDLCEIVV